MKLGERSIGLGLRAGLRWVVNPVSENGATQVSRFVIALAGTRVLHALGEMRRHPTGRRLLDERPELAAALTDRASLGRLPAGSFGRVYYDLMDHPDTIPGYLIAGLAYKDGFLDSVEMEDDARWFIERTFFTHDLAHVLSGYGTDLAGEALLILFNLGRMTRLSKRGAFATPFGLGALLLSPKIGRRAWRRRLEEAFDRGAEANAVYPYHSIPYEELLPRPLDEARATLGIPPLPAGWDTRDWLDRSVLARAAAGGFGQMERGKRRAKAAQAAVEAGVPWRDLMRAGPEAARRVRRLVRRGASAEEMRAALAA